MAKKQPKPSKAVMLNEEAMKGVWVDGLGVYVGLDYVIMEGVITKPRTDKPYVASRIMFPVRILETLVHTLNRVLEEHKKKLKTTKRKIVVEEGIVE